MTRKILDFLKSPSGKFLLFFLLIIIFAMLFRYYKSLPDTKKKEVQSFNDEVSIEREYVRFRDGYEELKSPQNKTVKSRQDQQLEDKEKKNDDLAKRLEELEEALAAERAHNALNAIKNNKAKDPKKPTENNAFSISPVELYTAKIVKSQKPEVLQDFAPYGRLIKCQLVNTVDSSSFETPIIALVSENIWHDGKIIIPAGTEVHGKASALTQRNRIAAEKEWVLVWRSRTEENGLELPLNAIALDYNKDINSGRYSITDGSAGLRGDVIETDEYSKLKLYAALFLKGAAEGVSELLLEEASSSDQNTLINSSQASPDNSKSNQENQIKVGIAKGAQEAADLYAKEMMDAISRDGVFIRVPAGRAFYLYVTQTIDKSKAGAGAATQAPEPSSDSSENNDLEEAQKIMLSLARKKLEQEEETKAQEEKK